MKCPFRVDRQSSIGAARPQSGCETAATSRRFAKRLDAALAVLTVSYVMPLRGLEAQTLPWMNTDLPPEKRAALLVDALTLEQKQQQLAGSPPEIVPELPQCKGARHVRGIASLGIPTLRITNGPVGIGQNDCVDPTDPTTDGFGAFSHPSSARATALPSATAVAASFDPGESGISFPIRFWLEQLGGDPR